MISQRQSKAVASGGTATIDMIGVRAPTTITAIPGGGGTMLIEYSSDETAAVLPGSANWKSWPSGTISVLTVDTLWSPVTAIRATATTAAGTVQVVG